MTNPLDYPDGKIIALIVVAAALCGLLAYVLLR